MVRFARYQDVAPKYVRPDGPKKKIADILDRPVLILGYNIAPSKFAGENNKDCTKIQLSFPDSPEDKFVIFTGSRVLMHQLRGIEESLKEGPILATLRKENRHFTFE